MATPRPIRMPRRALLGVPVLAVAAVTLVARPARASAARTPECLADLQGAS